MLLLFKLINPSTISAIITARLWIRIAELELIETHQGSKILRSTLEVKCEKIKKNVIAKRFN
ncbi:hypothetical protein C7H79_01590 [Nitrosomonas supralitoralis]|uniref:Uncharacterized protein n=1 Tax=Nitrosomonas supralitoralis TaxID=2116706 RepID=A0A2P7NZ53_9PROT|nr:hypothetical protein C7H79_01590 [Nitrosomonas supralitoralis]